MAHHRFKAARVMRRRYRSPAFRKRGWRDIRTPTPAVRRRSMPDQDEAARDAVKVDAVPLARLLTDVAFQADNHITIRLDREHGRIEVRQGAGAFPPVVRDIPCDPRCCDCGRVVRGRPVFVVDANRVRVRCS